MRWTWPLILAGIPCFSGRLMVPYVANVTGPIGKVRALDAATGQDIPGARVAFTTEYLPRGMLQPNHAMRRTKPEEAAARENRNTDRPYPSDSRGRFPAQELGRAAGRNHKDHGFRGCARMHPLECGD